MVEMCLLFTQDQAVRKLRVTGISCVTGFHKSVIAESGPGYF